MKIGKYEMDKFVKYLKENPQFMDKIMKLYNDFDLEKLKNFFLTLDLGSPFQSETLIHKRYIENKLVIDTLIRKPDAYPTVVQNKDFLDDEYTKEIYGNASRIYDSVWGGLWSYELRKEIVDSLALKPGDNVLEIGVGTGTNLESFPEYCKITGIDYNEKMLDVAKEKVTKLPKKKISLQLMDAHKMSFQDNHFDKVLSFYTLCSVRDPVRVLGEISRVCKRNGTIVIFDVIKSEIDEVAVLQYLFRPIAKHLGAIYLEFSPPYVISYDSFLGLFSLLGKTSIEKRRIQYSDPYKTVALLECTNQK